MTRVCVPDLADVAVLDVVDEDGQVRRVSVAHRDQAKEVLANGLRRFPPQLGSTQPAARAMATGATVLIADMPHEEVERLVHTSEHGAVVEALQMRSLIAAPLISRGRTLGALSLCATTDSGRRFTTADLPVAEELARRAALAVDNARLLHAAEAANRLKDEFLATVSHELRTPLNVMLGWLEMLRRGTVPAEKQARALETIERNARAQARLIEDLLDVSRIISGKLRLDFAPVELASLAEGVVESMRPAAEQRGLALTSSIDPAAGHVAGDASRLAQMVTNLVGNALKFTERGGRVAVSLARAGDKLELRVADDGRGIAPEFLPRVFDRFRQADGRGDRAHGGLGLGLAIVRQLVELHGGQVEAQSAGEGKGATFVVRLPRALELGGRQLDGRQGSAAPMLAAPPELKGRRALVVEDEADAREMVAAALERSGMKVTAAATAEAALETLRADLPDVIISDIGLPGMDGHAFLRHLRALPASQGGAIPALALTAFAGPEQRTRALLAGFQMHLTKPASPDELLVVLASLLSRQAN